MAPPARLLVQWNLTEACNLGCRHCYQEPGPDRGGGKELSWNQAQEVLDRLVALWRGWGVPGHLNLSGGEPLVCPWFWNLAEALAKAGHPTFAVLSNGTLIGPTEARRLKDLGCRFVQVSLDGTRKVHDCVRGPGTFDRAVAALRALRAAGVTTMVSFTAGVDNASEFPAVARLCRRLGVNTVWSDRLLPLGRGQEGQMLQPCDVEGYFRSMAAARPRPWEGWFSPTTIRMHRALQFHALEDLGVPSKPYSCTAGKTLLSLLADGTVVPCRRLPVAVGNALTDDLARLYETSPLLGRLRSAGVPEECQSCPTGELCRGGLRCLSQAYFGDPFRADPQCFKLYQTLPLRRAP